MQQSDLTSLLASLRALQEPSEPSQIPTETASVEISALSQSQLLSILSSLTSDAPPAPDDGLRPVTTNEAPSQRFAQSLRILSDLAQQQDFLDALGDMQREQIDEELRLKDARNYLVEQSKRTNSIASEKELREFDRSALERWEKLRGEQRGRLEGLGCPVFENGKGQRALIAVLLALMDD